MHHVNDGSVGVPIGRLAARACSDLSANWKWSVGMDTVVETRSLAQEVCRVNLISSQVFTDQNL